MAARHRMAHREKHDQQTREPPARALSFVVQRHDASRLHHDFRLELDGVLKSWAVPKMPPRASGQKVLAVEVEDHALEYGGFEGVIPAGQYGSGTVMLWDRGTWEPEGDPRAGLEKGQLSFTLAGERLQGRFSLVRMRGGREGKPQWLLIKRSDARPATASWDEPVRSVASGRTMEEIAGKETVSVAGVELTHPDRVLYPEMGLTKRDLALYYVAIVDHVLPHVVGRPLTLVRCPRGQGQPCFYQKHVDASVAAPVVAIEVEERKGSALYASVNDLAGLVTLVQIGVLELHPWGSRKDRLDRPDRIVIDLDPGPGVEWEHVVATAHALRERLADLELAAFVRTTGGKGLHVVVPIERRSTWEDVKAFAHGVASELERSDPALYVTTASKAKRKGKIYLDYLRNDRGATSIASYSSRARPDATVATPLRWEELTPQLDPAQFTVRSVPERLKASGAEPWADFFTLRQSLSKRRGR